MAFRADEPLTNVVGKPPGLSSARLLADRLPSAKVIAIDLSAAMLGVARIRLPARRSGPVRADFHHLPLAAQSLDLAVAAFCLYHSPSPGKVISEIARSLRPGGTAILVTKSADSYRELDRLVYAAGLDTDALSRPSLYEAAHSGNLVSLSQQHLHVEEVISQVHRFAFSSPAGLAEYLATSPKYQFPSRLTASPEALTAALQDQFRDGPVTTTSTVTYITATPRSGACA